MVHNGDQNATTPTWKMKVSTKKNKFENKIKKKNGNFLKNTFFDRWRRQKRVCDDDDSAEKNKNTPQRQGKTMIF